MTYGFESSRVLPPRRTMSSEAVAAEAPARRAAMASAKIRIERTLVMVTPGQKFYTRFRAILSTRCSTGCGAPCRPKIDCCWTAFEKNSGNPPPSGTICFARSSAREGPLLRRHLGSPDRRRPRRPVGRARDSRVAAEGLGRSVASVHAHEAAGGSPEEDFRDVRRDGGRRDHARPLRRARRGSPAPGRDGRDRVGPRASKSEIPGHAFAAALVGRADSASPKSPARSSNKSARRSRRRRPRWPPRTRTKRSGSARSGSSRNSPARSFCRSS